MLCHAEAPCPHLVCQNICAIRVRSLCLLKLAGLRLALNLLIEWQESSFSWAQVNRKRGGEGANTSLTTVDNAPESTGSDTTPLTGNGTTENNNESQQHSIDNIPVTYPHENGLLCEVKDQYSKDPFYKKILDSPKAFKNFELVDGFI